MLPLPSFDIVQPRSARDAVAARAAEPQSLYLAGGTDLLVNLKHGLHAPRLLVDLTRVEGLGAIRELPDGGLALGAMVRLESLATSALVALRAPGLATAAAAIAGPQHRRAGTLGGNVLLDTRCLFYNQTEFWRASIGFCLKKDGEHCHVSGSPKGCVAAQSSDTVPMLTALEATAHFLLPDGAAHTVPLAGLFGKDGRYERVHQIPTGALLTEVQVPPRRGWVAAYHKVRSRAAIDYPQLSVAVAAKFEGTTLRQLSLAVGAMLPAPRLVGPFDDLFGKPLDDAAIDQIALRVGKACRPMTSVHGDPAWRRHMAVVETRRALNSLR